MRQGHLEADEATSVRNIENWIEHNEIREYKACGGFEH